MAKKKVAKINNVFSPTEFRYTIISNEMVIAKLTNESDRNTCFGHLQETYPDCDFISGTSDED